MEILFLVGVLVALIIVCWLDYSRKRREFLEEQQKLLARKDIQKV